MPRTATEAERERKRAQNQPLASKYNAIGPAAVLAAVLCATRQRLRQTASNAEKPA